MPLLPDGTRAPYPGEPQGMAAGPPPTQAPDMGGAGGLDQGGMDGAGAPPSFPSVDPQTIISLIKALQAHDEEQLNALLQEHAAQAVSQLDAAQRDAAAQALQAVADGLAADAQTLDGPASALDAQAAPETAGAPPPDQGGGMPGEMQGGQEPWPQG